MAQPGDCLEELEKPGGYSLFRRMSGSLLR